jgi:ankyrin repeat protein
MGSGAFGLSIMSNTLAIHAAYKKGDVDALRAELGHPPDFPNSRGPRGIGEIVLEYAIYHSPLEFIRRLLELGAEPNYEDHAGFPSIIAALSSERPDKLEIIELLLSFGADLQQVGFNGYTPLHHAAAANDIKSIDFLMSKGADPQAKTNVDDFATPLEEAEILGVTDAVKALQRWQPG